MDRPRNPDEDDAFRRRVAESVDSESDSEDAVGSTSYAVARDGGDGGGRDDEHAATAADGSPIDDTHEATAVGGGTIYSTAPDDATEDPLDASGMQWGAVGRPPPGQASDSGGGALPPAPPIDGGAGGRPPAGQASDSSGTPPPPPERGYDERGQPIPNFEDGGSTESAGDGPETYEVREGVTRAIDPEDYSSIRNEQELTQESTHSRAESVGGFNPDAGLARPPDLPESVQVTDVAPDGTSIGRGSLTSPTGEAIGGSGLSGAFESALGGRGSRGVDAFLDPLSSSSGPDSDLGGFGPDARRGGTDSHFASVNEMRGARGEPDMTRQEYDEAYGGAGTVPLGEIDWGMINAIRDADFTDVLVGMVNEAGVAAVFPDEDGKSATQTILEQEHASFWGLGSGDADDEEQPDPAAGDDVITEESIEAAIRANDPGVYAQTTADGGTDDGTATNLAWAAPANDPRLTNYGPDGPQNVEVGANWAPPSDGIFDPPPEGASAGMLGEASAMADPAAAMGGSVIGSGVPEDFPPPPDPPPGDDPVGPPPDGGGDS